MPVVRRKLQPSDVYPDDIRYNADTDHVQRLVNGDWVDSPESDPRTHTTLPPRSTSDPACDAAQSVTDAIKGQIDSILTAIDNAQTAFTIAGLVLGLFTFGVFEIFIAIALGIANAMLDAGTATLEAALTDPVYHTLMCILFCHMDGSGRLIEGSLTDVLLQVDDQIGGVGAATLYAFLQLAGEGGINNLASLGLATGDCDDCGCAEPCSSADSFYAGTVNSILDNGDGTITFNVSSIDNGAGTQFIGWGDRSNPDSPCCVFGGLSDSSGLGTIGGAVQECSTSTEIGVQPTVDSCYHFWLVYHNDNLGVAFDMDFTFAADCP